jgi:DNA-binding MarR family transcriptional regulator
VRYNCCVGIAPTDAEFQQLLRLLLRVVGQAAMPGSEADGLATVSGTEARALTELLAARGIAQGQLAALLGLEKSTVSRLAAGLERKGWIRRGRDESNQRYIRLYLTPEGRALAGRVWRAWWSRQAQILADLTPEERAGLAVGLRGLARSLATQRTPAEAPPADTPPAVSRAGGPRTRAPRRHPQTVSWKAP